MFLVKDRIAAGTINIAAGSAEQVRFAASELQAYIRKITGVLIPVCSGEREDIIVKIGLPTEAHTGDEGYSIRCDGECLYIDGDGPAGVVYGVYGFLREYCGVSFAGFSTEGEYIPSFASLEIPVTDKNYRPHLWYRGFQFTVIGEVDGCRRNTWKELAQKRIDWMAKNGMNYVQYNPVFEGRSSEFSRIYVFGRHFWYTNKWFRENLLPEIRKRGLKLEQSHHNMSFYLPPERYYREHPEYYSIMGGRRNLSSQFIICTSNSDAVDQLTCNILKFVEENPEVDIIGLMPEDGFGMCECEECRKLDSPEYDTVSVEYMDYGRDQNKTRRYARLLNHVAGAVKERFPEKLVSALFYIDISWPPEDMTLESNILPVICMYGRCFSHSYFNKDCPVNRGFRDLVRIWSNALKGKKIIYEYYMGFSSYRNLPYPIANIISGEWPELEKMGIGGATIQGFLTGSEMYGLNYYVFARRGWDMSVGFESMLDDYLLGMYGTAGRLVKPVFSELYRKPDACGTAGKCSRINIESFFNIYGEDDVMRARGIIAGAIRTTRHKHEKIQLERLMAVIDFTEMVRKASGNIRKAAVLSELPEVKQYCDSKVQLRESADKYAEGTDEELHRDFKKAGFLVSDTDSRDMDVWPNDDSPGRLNAIEAFDEIRAECIREIEGIIEFGEKYFDSGYFSLESMEFQWYKVLRKLGKDI